MKPVLAFSILILFHFTAALCSKSTAQQLQQEIDSLDRLLESYREMDTTRLKLLTELAFNYHFIDPDKGLENAAEAEKLARQLQYLPGLAMAFSRKGVNYWAKGQDSLAMDATNAALDIYRKLGNHLSYAKTLNNRALNHYALGEYGEALRDHQEALEVFLKLDHHDGIQHSYNNIGTVFMAISDYQRALEAFLNGLKTGETRDWYLKPNILMNIGLVLKNQGEYHRALEYEEQALKLHLQAGNERGIGLSYSNMGSIFDLLGQPEKAIGFFNRSLEISRKSGNESRIASDMTNIGIVYRDMGNADTAIAYLEDAVRRYRKQGDKGNLSIALIALAAARDSLGTTRSGEMEVLRLQLEALQAARESGTPLRESEALQALSGTYERLGMGQEALGAYKQHVSLRDTIFNQEKAREITRKQMGFDFERKEAAARAEIERQKIIRNSSLLGGSGLLFAGIFGFLLYKRRKDLKFQKQEAEYKATVAETELSALRARLNPHFVFNSLNSIGDYMLKHQKEDAREYLASFARLMRMTLEYSYQKEITLKEDLNFLRLYLDIEKKRLGERLTYRISVEPGIDQDAVVVPPLFLQPFIENSIWHGIAPKAGAGHVHVDIRKEDSLLLCIVDDNGLGREASADSDARGRERPKKSRGISLTQSQLEIFGRRHNGKGSIRIWDEEKQKGTKIEIRLPMVSAF